MDIKDLRDRSRYLGSPSQLYGVEKYISADGPSAGNAYFRVRTGGGLEYTISEGTALDIASLTYKGLPIITFRKTDRSPLPFTTRRTANFFILSTQECFTHADLLLPATNVKRAE